jgi:CheY-like chemotaxis protein
VAKILVADDNSNIQKMVGLALKDQGIDVVAVGNGEAAVRKISDIRPDLVLADVFMPVRNGYEVCQYVKSDSSLSHVPVILLVGAFDPLDEQEAQRVGADGVLKKPFVPPDPLISMVKSALARAGVAVSGPPSEGTLRPLAAADLLRPGAEPHPLPGSSPITMPSSISLPALDEPQEFSTRPAPLSIDAEKIPLAFGNLLNTAAPAETEEDLGLIPAVHPELATERDWRSGEEEVEEETEEAPKGSWRRDGEDENFDGDETESAVHDWRQMGPSEKDGTGAWTPTAEKTKIEEPEEVKEEVSANVAETVLADMRSPEPATPFSGKAWSAAVSAGEEKPPTTIPEVPSEVPVYAAPPEPVEVAQEAKAEVPVYVPPANEAKTAETGTGNSWFSTTASPWEAEAEKASRLASTWDAPVSTATTTVEAAPAAPEPVTVPEASSVVEEKRESSTEESETGSPAGEPEPLNGYHGGSAYASESLLEQVATHPREASDEAMALPAETVEAIREEAAQVAEESQQQAPAAVNVESTPRAQEPDMNDLVAKVMARMSPETLQAMTRELLKPVVEAMVKEELNSKK